jgi:hypothetical protein
MNPSTQRQQAHAIAIPALPKMPIFPELTIATRSIIKVEKLG